ncbi:hypothetical protein V6N12_063908 [Hibiscus sabdariffa]|uniref:CRIB domain-containing protein n=1 Tax=Hibiscus sabdariffa TaxID=183260 RepID=A0ABR2ARK1_9ROSI
MEIGEPTDVIHVAHIGVDHSSTVAPSWMKEFKIGPDKTTKSSDNAEVSHPTALSTRSMLGSLLAYNKSVMEIPEEHEQGATSGANTSELGIQNQDPQTGEAAPKARRGVRERKPPKALTDFVLF